ncbi:fatty acid desaturase [Enhydrobacter sp.]|jgi:fatty acid desaturase|uniref:fatty acid desaturase n=1 Tax=Enhydrobacter sp. TaxID=1894999 RepID=UPI00260F0950|nr:fatty acid desaturase [Enhydrobacter sp.]WIM10002.1 MAG: Fatty acid desaturase [Enhydrobacter sp.]
MSIAEARTPDRAASRPVTHSRLRQLSALRNGPAVLRMATHLGAIAVMAALILVVADKLGFAWAFPLILCQGFLVAFLFMPLHEAVHKTAFRTRWLNIAFGHLCGAAIGFPYEYYSVFHWEHHRHTQDPAKDPELLVMPLPGSSAQLVLAFSGALQVYGRLRLMLTHALTGKVTAPWVPADKHALIVREARCYLLAYVLLLIGSLALRTPVLLLVWIVPLFFGQFFLRPYLYAEHTGCGRSRDAFENTRTTYARGLVKWFAWNMPYHVEHHAYPSVPFHALHELNGLVAGRIVHGEPGYRHSIGKAWRWLRAASRGEVSA